MPFSLYIMYDIAYSAFKHLLFPSVVWFPLCFSWSNRLCDAYVVRRLGLYIKLYGNKLTYSAGLQ